jgi:hypothetical protein
LLPTPTSKTSGFATPSTKSQRDGSVFREGLDLPHLRKPTVGQISFIGCIPRSGRKFGKVHEFDIGSKIN